MQTRATRLPEGTRLSGRLTDTYAVLSERGLRPIVDEVREVVLSDCPVCDVGALDPLDIHRPLTVACWTEKPSDPVRMRCFSGCSTEAIRQALAEPPVDWRAVAEEYRAIADGALAQLDALIARDADPALQVAA